MPPQRTPRVEFTGQLPGERQAQENQTIAAAGAGAAQPDLARLAAILDAEDGQPIERQPSPTGEPMTAGLSIGAGPGPEILPPRARSGPGAPRIDVELFAPQLPVLETLAASPGASPEMIAWYRRLRSQIPVDVHVMPSGSRGPDNGQGQPPQG